MKTTNTYKTESHGTEATRANPCLLCNSDHWCFHLSDDAVICGKTDLAPDGWHKTGEAIDGRGIYTKAGSRKNRKGTLPNPDDILPLTLDPKTDSPQWVTLSIVGNESELQVEYLYPDEDGRPLGKVIVKQWTDRRAAYGRNKRETKEVRPHHWQETHHPDQGDKGWWSDRGKGPKPWPLYRQKEVENSLDEWGDTKVVFYVAGEKCVEAARELGLTAFTNQGGEGSYLQSIVDFLSKNKPELFVIWPDFDDTGKKSSAKLLDICTKADIPTILINPENIWLDMPPKGDIYDVVVTSGMDSSEIVEKLQIEIRRALLQRQAEVDQTRQKGQKLPTARQKALEIAERYQPLWAFDNSQKTWRLFNGKSWDALEDDGFSRMVYNVVKSAGDEWAAPTYIENVAKILRWELMVEQWSTFDRKRYIAFNNCVLDAETKELLDHSPGFRFTSYLPFDYDPAVALSYKADPIAALEHLCPRIYSYMIRAMDGDKKRILKLLAIINGALKFRFHDLQMFSHLVGKPGTGKGTFARILQKIVGDANCTASSLTALGEGTEIASLIGSQLVVFPDERRQVGLEVLLKLTGGDRVRYREIYKKPGNSPFYGLLLVLSNNPIFAGDCTGLERRLCLTQFINPIPRNLRDSKAEQLMDAELSNLIPIALALDDTQVTSLIKGLGDDEIPAFKQQEWLMKCQTNSIAFWLNEWVVRESDAEISIGDGRRAENGSEKETAYGHYRDCCEISGLKAFSLVGFSNNLIDLLKESLDWEVNKIRTRTGMKLQGIRLRQLGVDDQIPRIDESFNINPPNPPDDTPPDDKPPENPTPSNPNPGGEGSVKGCEGLCEGFKPALDKDCVGCEGLNTSIDLNDQQQSVEQNEANTKYQNVGEQPYIPTPPSQGKDFNPSPSVHNPSPSVHNPSHPAIKVGDSVRSPDGLIGIVSLTYSDGLFGVDYENGRKFCRWEPAELTIVEPDGGNDDPSPEGGGGNQPVSPSPSDDDGGGVDESLTDPQQHQQNSETSSTNSVESVEVSSTSHQQTSTPESSQQILLDLNLVEPKAAPIEVPVGVEWLDPETPEYPEQCEVIANAPIVSLDIETYEQTKPKRNATPKALHPWESGIRLIQLCIGERTFLIDLGDRNSDPGASLEKHKSTSQLLKRVIQNPQQRIVGHNIHFDLRFLATKLGIRNAKNVVCTRVGAQVYYGDYGLLEGDNHKGKHESILKGGYSLANLAHRLLDKELDKGEQKSDWGAELTSEQISYAAEDPKVTLEVYQKLEALYVDKSLPLYSETLRECWKLECDVIPCAIEIELTGMPIDLKAARANLDKIEAHRQKLLADWSKLCPDINYTQQAKLISFLNAKYQLGLTSLSKTELSKEARDNPVVQIMLKLQGLKIEANTLNGFIASATRDGRVHTTYKTLTGTGRFSSGGKVTDLPNLQSIKAKTNPLLNDLDLPSVREVITPQKGRTMAVVDLAGAHARIAASETQDAIAIAGSNDPSIDNHLKVAVFVAKAQGIDWTAEYIGKARKDKTNPDSVKAKLFRDTAKNTYYGWLNGAGAETVQRQIRGNTGVEPSITECQSAIEGCKALYPGVLQHRKQLMYRLRTTAINIDGRPCAVNNIRGGFRICMPLVANNKYNEGRLEPPYASSIACIWSRIEATAVKMALVQIMREREAHPEWNLEVINYVHDEIDIEVDTDFASVAVPLVNDTIGDCFASLLDGVSDGRETDWKKLVVNNWSEK